MHGPDHGGRPPARTSSAAAESPLPAAGVPRWSRHSAASAAMYPSVTYDARSSGHLTSVRASDAAARSAMHSLRLPSSEWPRARCRRIAALDCGDRSAPASRAASARSSASRPRPRSLARLLFLISTYAICSRSSPSCASRSARSGPLRRSPHITKVLTQPPAELGESAGQPEADRSSPIQRRSLTKPGSERASHSAAARTAAPPRELSVLASSRKSRLRWSSSSRLGTRTTHGAASAGTIHRRAVAEAEIHRLTMEDRTQQPPVGGVRNGVSVLPAAQQDPHGLPRRQVQPLGCRL